jgi:hypothetical protein
MDLMMLGRLKYMQLRLGGWMGYWKDENIDQFWQNWANQAIKEFKSEDSKLIYPIWNNEELPQHWMESTTVPDYKKGDILIPVIVACYHTKL